MLLISFDCKQFSVDLFVQSFEAVFVTIDASLPKPVEDFALLALLLVFLPYAPHVTKPLDCGVYRRMDSGL